MLNIKDVLDILALPLLGVVPESEEVLRASNLGSPITLNDPTSAPARAYRDAASKLRGKRAVVIRLTAKAFSTSCSSGGRHEPFRFLSPSW